MALEYFREGRGASSRQLPGQARARARPRPGPGRAELISAESDHTN